MYEGECELHGKPIGDTKADYIKTLINLGANPEDPFTIYQEVASHYAAILSKKTEKASRSTKTKKRPKGHPNNTSSIFRII